MQEKPAPREVGSLYGYQIIVQEGEYEDPYTTHKWKVPTGNLETDDPNKVFLARTAFSLDSIVTGVASLTAERLRDRKAVESKIAKAGFDPRTTFMTFLMRRLVTQVIAHRELPDGCKGDISPFWLLKAEQVLMDMTAAQDRAANTSRPASTHSLGMRILQAQYHDQLDYSGYKRELWLNRRTVEEARSLGLDLEGVYRKAYGLSYSELAFLSFAAFSTLAAKAGNTIEPSTWDRMKTTRIAPDQIDAFFNACSTDYAAFKSNATVREVAPQGYDIYSLSPLVRWPLVKRTDGHLVAPVIADLLERPTRAFPIDALKALSEQRVAARGQFYQAVGAAYEQYVWDSLVSAPGAGEVRRAHDMVPSGSKNCDFICLEAKAATLVEAKAVRLRLIADITKERDLLREEFARENGVADGLIQLNETARAIRQRRTEIPKGILLNTLLVIRGEQVLLNSEFVRRILEELVLERSGSKMIVKYQIINDEGFDALIRMLCTGRSLSKFLYGKRKTKIRDTRDMHHEVWQQVSSLPDHPLKATIEGALDDLMRFGLGDQAPPSEPSE